MSVKVMVDEDMVLFINEDGALGVSIDAVFAALADAGVLEVERIPVGTDGIDERWLGRYVETEWREAN